MSTTPPFRADHVGSLLRPKSVLDARARRARGEIAAEDLREIEDEAIDGIVKRQEEVGLEAITDGEFRREMFHVDFLKNLNGVAVTGGLAVKFRSTEGEKQFAPPKLEVVGRIERGREISVSDFTYLKDKVGKTPKLCIPSPTMMHFRTGRKGIPSEIYPDIEDFFSDLCRAYREEIAALGKAGCTYLQLDDTNLAYLCDPNMRERTRAMGEDPDTLPRLYARIINDAISSRPKDMSVCIHLCRGNFRSAWVAEGGYEPVADVLLNELEVDGYFLEYDDERSGDFAPLRFTPKGKTVVLGLVTSKQPELETKEELKQRIDEAAQYVDGDQLALSPQCGFSSTVHGNEMTEADEFAKLALVVETAREVWG